MQKLIVAMLAGNCEKTIDLALESVKDADKILVIYDATSKDSTLNKLIKWEEKLKHKLEFRSRVYEHDYKVVGANGQARNFYLDILKRNKLYNEDDWCLVIDADEMIDDNGIQYLREFIKQEHKDDEDRPCGVYSVHMRHLIGDLGHEDAVNQTHFVPNRLFQLKYAKDYPEREHPILRSINDIYGRTNCTTVWHLSHLPIPYIDYIIDRYKTHLAKSDTHNPQFLSQWVTAHLFGQYPRTVVQPIDLPRILLARFDIDKDDIYFSTRGYETKHFIDAFNWREFFKPKDVIEVGCGRGPRVGAMRIVGLNAKGYDNNKRAVELKLTPECYLWDLTNEVLPQEPVDLVICYDVLEHIDYNNIDRAIDNVIALSKQHILVSVPCLGSSDLEADKTHRIKEHREWWIKKFTDRGLKLIPVPENWLWRFQLLIFEK